MKYKSHFIFKVFYIVSCFFIFCFCTSCTSKKKEGFLIGVDPSWFPLEVYGKEPNMLAFTNELLKRISEIEKVPIQRVNISWDSLLEGLDRGKYHAILNSMQPYNFNLEKYSFSDNFLMTGPVLVVREDATKSTLENLYEKEIAIFSDSQQELLSERYPDSIGRLYVQVTAALTDIIIGSIDGALISNLEASGYVADIYNGRLKIVSKPFTQEGLKLVALRDKEKFLIEIFNRGLASLKSSGEYEMLLKKWKLSY